MLFTIAAAVLALPLIARAAPSPFSPTSFKIGDECTITWGADPTGLWTSMNIQLMTGPDSPMVHMKTLTTIDATKETEYTFTCPEVTPASKIYFIQFTSSADPKNTLWTTRWILAPADGSEPPAPEFTNAAGREWGTGAFVDPSEYNAPPTYLAGNGQILGSTLNGTSSSISGSATGTVSSIGSSTTGAATVTQVISSAASSITGSASVTGSVTSRLTTSVTGSHTGTSSASAASGTTSSNAAVANGSASWVVLACAAAFGAIASF